ncbi:hypothetical protein ACH4FX_12395 [Streptomyces sp. NPDC018019]|uniref:hypothetical protein n=1 Tax=Streptomyces sp. NPDC018019 TaxID=3365030 RepID=UPI00378D14A4
MPSMQPAAADGDGPRQPKVIVLALASGYVAGYVAAFGTGVDIRHIAVEAMAAVTSWLLWRYRR